jgi:hypothetical protein
MRVKLVARDEDQRGEVARWQREVEREYPGVPRVGDWVFLDDDRPGMAAHPVTHVVWENDGAVALSFNLSASAAFLESLGFSRFA